MPFLIRLNILSDALWTRGFRSTRLTAGSRSQWSERMRRLFQAGERSEAVPSQQILTQRTQQQPPQLSTGKQPTIHREQLCISSTDTWLLLLFCWHFVTGNWFFREGAEATGHYLFDPNDLLLFILPDNLHQHCVSLQRLFKARDSPDNQGNLSLDYHMLSRG